jgi:hypothetical protein
MARQRGLFIFWSQTTMRLFQRVKSYFWRFRLSNSSNPSPDYVYEKCLHKLCYIKYTCGGSISYKIDSYNFLSHVYNTPYILQFSEEREKRIVDYSIYRIFKEYHNAGYNVLTWKFHLNLLNKIEYVDK